MKNIYVKDIRSNVRVEDSFMIMKKLFREENKLTCFIGDKTGDIKTVLLDKENSLKVGDVIKVVGKKEDYFEVNNFSKIDDYDLEDYLPTINKPIEDIMNEIERISYEEFKSKEAIALNSYFFKDNIFLERFKNGIGGLSQHHNYRGGLAEHTLNVMYLAKTLAYRYDCRNKEIAILAAKLHDIGKVVEYNTDRPFEVSIRGNMEGHIVIGVLMVEEAFNKEKDIYSEDFKNRIKGCIIQHHGKLEYGSPKIPNMEEAYIVHYADYIDATFNKIGQIKDITEVNTWSEYDRRIGTRLYL